MTENSQNGFSLKDWRESRKKDKIENDKKRLTAIAREKIQAKEFAGHLYLSYNGKPLVAVEYLNIPLPDMLSIARSAYVVYKTQDL